MRSSLSCERLGELRDCVLVEHWAAAVDDHPGLLSPHRCECDFDRAARLVVAHGVLDHVLDHPPEQRAAARDLDLRKMSLDAEPLGGDLLGSDDERGADDRLECDLTGLVELAVLGAGEGEEALQQPVGVVEIHAQLGVELPGLRWTPPGLAIATSRVVRIIASGVRSSWEAFATNRRCASNAASKRPSSRSIVSASSRSSSRGPGIARRSCRFVSEIRSAVAVIVRSGASTRPATTHPSTRNERHDRQRDPRSELQAAQTDRALVGIAVTTSNWPDRRVPPGPSWVSEGTIAKLANSQYVIASSAAPQIRNRKL